MPKFVNKWGEHSVRESIKLTKSPWLPMTGGTNNEDVKYKNKYLIYKNKYLKLKLLIK